ncbi:MAG: patatin-like phospholipase family protein [Candidatus Berkiellales bacterium]
MKTGIFEQIIEAMDEKQPNFDALFAIVKMLEAQLNSHFPPLPPIKRAAWQGGGVKGKALVGAFRAMSQCGVADLFDENVAASAGAVPSFLIGLGASDLQMAKISKRLLFEDMCDLVESSLGNTAGGYTAVQLGHAVTQGHVFSGENFYNWACSLLEFVTGDPEITFQELHDMRKNNPALKDMVFKATRLKPQGSESSKQTLSYRHSPNVMVIGSLCGSKAYPGAYEAWKVFEKTPQGTRLFGVFSDGGLTSNFPIDEFDHQLYEDPNYPLVWNQVIFCNPTSVGLSLCSLSELDDALTPITPKLMDLKRKQKPKKGKDEKLKEGSPQIIPKLKIKDILKPVFAALVGEFKSVEDMPAKYQAHPTQVVQIYTEEVDTLDFKLSPARQEMLESSGYTAWMQWYQKFQDPALVYLTGSDFKMTFDSRDSKGITKEKFVEMLKEYFLVLLNEAQGKVKHPIPSFREPLKNQRLKFYSHLIISTMSNIGHFGLSQDEVLKEAFLKAVQHFAQTRKKIQEARARLDQFIDDDQNLQLMLSYMTTFDPRLHARALRMFKGKLSHCLPFARKNNNQVLLSAAKSGVALLKGMLQTIQKTFAMLEQQGRKTSFSFQGLMAEATENGIFEYAMRSLEPLEVIKTLLDFGCDPLMLDKDHKNAFHHAIDHENIQVLAALIEHCQKKQEAQKGQETPFAARYFSPDGLALGEYILLNAADDFIQQLKMNGLIIKRIITSKDLSTFDFEGAKRKLTERRALCQQKMTDLKAKLLVNEHVKFVKEEIPPKIALRLLHMTDESGVNLLCRCIGKNDPKLNALITVLCNKVKEEQKLVAELKRLFNVKCQGKTPLYFAAAAKNSQFINEFMLPYELRVDDAGPLDNPSALTAAAQSGALEAVIAIMKKKPTSPRVGNYLEGKTALHYLAQNPEGCDAFWTVLNGSKIRYTKATNSVDNDGFTPFRYVAMNDKAEAFFKSLIAKGKGIVKSTYLNFYFDLLTPRAGGLSDLEWVKKLFPELYTNVIAPHLNLEPLKEEEADASLSSPEIERKDPTPLTPLLKGKTEAQGSLKSAASFDGLPGEAYSDGEEVGLRRSASYDGKR